MARGTRLLIGWLAALICCLSVFQATSARGRGEVASVVHADVLSTTLTLADLRRITLGDREFWPGSARITLLVRAPVARERDVVLKTIAR